MKVKTKKLKSRIYLKFESLGDRNSGERFFTGFAIKGAPYEWTGKEHIGKFTVEIVLLTKSFDIGVSETKRDPTSDQLND